MNKQAFGRWLGAAVLVGATLVSAGVASAAGTSDAGLVANGTWRALPAGQQDWYSFEYAGDGSQILVRMDAANAGSASFAVWTPENLKQWQAGQAVEPVGRGTVNDLYGGALIWSGEFNEAGTYYVVVQGDGASSYALSITGSGVALPAAAGAKAEAAGTAGEVAKTTAAVIATPQEAAAKATAAAAKNGTGPTDALAKATGKWTAIGAGQETWYAFNCSGDESEVVVRMAVDPNNPASFSVWTPDQIASGASEPVGRGSADAALGGDLTWAGSFNQPGTYYVVVSGGSSPTGYALTIQ